MLNFANFPGKIAQILVQRTFFAQILIILFKKVIRFLQISYSLYFSFVMFYLLFLFIFSGVVVHRRHEGTAEPLKRRRENEDRGTMIINDDDLTRIAHQLYRSQNKYHSRWKAKVVINWLPDQDDNNVVEFFSS
jgi:hypothetical protein